jgi:hypothetical protein
MAPLTRAEISPTQVVLGTATKGGGFELFGTNATAVINQADNSLRVEALPTKGSKQNLLLLEAGKIDIGLVEGNAARQALGGIGRTPANLKVLWVMYPNPGMFVVRADASYQTIGDLKGQRIAWGTRASGLRILARDVMDGLGLIPNQDFQPVILKKAAEGPLLVLEGQVAALWGAGIGWPGFEKVANAPTGARFIAPDKEQLKRIQEKYPHLRPMSVPPGTYRGQDHRIESVGLWALILVRPDVSDDTVHRLARALHRSEPTLAARLQQGRYTTAENTANQVPRDRLHPGAVRYLKELGALR